MKPSTILGLATIRVWVTFQPVMLLKGLVPIYPNVVCILMKFGGITGIALTKLDGTAKGGMIFALAKQIGVPIRFLGVGEGINDLQDFNAEQFIDALFVTD